MSGEQKRTILQVIILVFSAYASVTVTIIGFGGKKYIDYTMYKFKQVDAIETRVKTVELENNNQDRSINTNAGQLRALVDEFNKLHPHNKILIYELDHH